MEDYIKKLQERQSKAVDLAKKTAIDNKSIEEIINSKIKIPKETVSETTSGLTQEQIEGLI